MNTLKKIGTGIVWILATLLIIYVIMVGSFQQEKDQQVVAGEGYSSQMNTNQSNERIASTSTKKPTATPTKRPTSTPTKKPTPTPTPKSVGRAGAGTASKQFRLSLNATCGNYNHVGNEWSIEYYIDGKRVYNNATVTLKSGQTIEVKAVITEDDKYPDVGYATFRHTVTESELTKGFSTSFSVRVTEDRGNYRGYSCTWNVTFWFNT